MPNGNRPVVFVIVQILAFCSISTAVADDVLVHAIDFKKKDGNYSAPDARWSNLGVLHGASGSVTWEFKIVKEGDYHIQSLYASRDSRPCKIQIASSGLVSPIVKEPVMDRETGGFHAENLKWHDCGAFHLKPGDYAMTLSVSRYMPHLRGFRLTTDASLPKEDLFTKELDERKRTKKRKAWKNHDKAIPGARSEVRKLLPDVSQILFIKRPTFQSTHYYTDFIDGTVHYGSELCLLSLENGSVKNLVPSLREGIIGRCNLSFDGKKVIFDYKAREGEGFRIWEVGVDGSGLRQLTFPPDDEERRMEKFGMPGNKRYRHHTDDMHPAYLPDGGFVFASTRCEYGILCDGADVLTTSVIYRADKDGGHIEKLSNNALSESAPTILLDGRILYTRWEYVDNGAVTNKGLWVMNPDGTASNEIYGANIAFPSVFNVARQIPGEPTKFVCVGAPHMPLGVGTVLVVDATFDRRTVDGVRYVTPEIDQQHQWGWQRPTDGKSFRRLYEHPTVQEVSIQTSHERDGAGNTASGPLFMDPFPIDEHRFLVAHNPSSPWNEIDAYGLFLIDDAGKRALLFRDDQWSCWNPIPVRPSPTPRVPVSSRDSGLAEQNLAQLMAVDVYVGMENVPRGTIKYLRINEHVPRPWSARRAWPGDEFDQQHSVVSLKTHLGLKVQHGVVPVEKDGSANFLVPADKNIFLQALDENYREVQRERTFVNYRPGETRACIGCHEPASATQMAKGLGSPLALRRPPQTPGPQPGEATGRRPISYFEDVQPVLDRHCVRCHNAEKTDGGIDLSGTLTERFNISYENLLKWNAFPVIGENHPKAGNNHYLPPYSLGSHASKLVKLLDDGHYDVKMPIGDWVRLTTWIDSNGQYYGTYFGRKNLRHKEHPDFRPIPTFQETQSHLPPGVRKPE